MNTQPNAVPEPQAGSPAIAPAPVQATRPICWSVQRELWENRSIYIAPLTVAAVIVFGFLVSMLTLPYRMRAASALGPSEQRQAMTMPYEIAATLIMGATFIVGIFYCLEALYGERRDRSILFWKSLPVSDLTTVLSKMTIPLVILPVLGFAISVVTLCIMLLLNTVVLFVSGLSVATLWAQAPVFRISLIVFYHFLTAHTLWYAPIYAWLLLVSGWARRAAFLWALLPPLAICAIEKLAFNTMHFTSLLQYRLQGPEDVTPAALEHGAIIPLTWKFLSLPGLWTGLTLAAVFLAAAVRQRRYRGPI
jgi:ABC-2 type transport system permease protein